MTFPISTPLTSDRRGTDHGRRRPHRGQESKPGPRPTGEGDAGNLCEVEHVSLGSVCHAARQGWRVRNTSRVSEGPGGRRQAGRPGGSPGRRGPHLWPFDATVTAAAAPVSAAGVDSTAGYPRWRCRPGASVFPDVRLKPAVDSTPTTATSPPALLPPARRPTRRPGQCSLPPARAVKASSLSRTCSPGAGNSPKPPPLPLPTRLSPHSLTRKGYGTPQERRRRSRTTAAAPRCCSIVSVNKGSSAECCEKSIAEISRPESPDGPLYLLGAIRDGSRNRALRLSGTSADRWLAGHGDSPPRTGGKAPLAC